jgi:hypothetical protein
MVFLQDWRVRRPHFSGFGWAITFFVLALGIGVAALIWFVWCVQNARPASDGTSLEWMVAAVYGLIALGVGALLLYGYGARIWNRTLDDVPPSSA